MELLPLGKTSKEKIARYNLSKKFDKQISLLLTNQKYPSLNVELLEPKKLGFYSFRIDRKFRAVFVFHKDLNAIEVITITNHYK